MRKRTFGTKLTLRDVQASIRAQMPHDMSKVKLPDFMSVKPRAPRSPIQRNKHEEHDTQAEVVRYIRHMCPSVVLSASLNGELWGMARHVPKGVFFGWVAKLKSRGMLPGYADLVLHWAPRRTVFLEMKTKAGTESDAQIGIRSLLERLGFKTYRCEGIEDLKEIIKIEVIPCIEH